MRQARPQRCSSLAVSCLLLRRCWCGPRPRVGALEAGVGAGRGWAVPPSSQILYKQTWVEEKEEAQAQLEEDSELPAYADTPFLYQAFSGQLRTG